MPTILKCGLALGALFGGYSLLVAVAGWYTSVFLSFWMLLILEFAGAVGALALTARDGRGYLRQVLAGTAMFAVAAAVMFVAAFLTLTWVTPDYADVIVNAERERILATGNAPADLEERLAGLHAMYTPIRQSWFVVPATIVTGLAFSLVIAIVVRRRGPAGPPPAAAAPDSLA